MPTDFKGFSVIYAQKSAHNVQVVIRLFSDYFDYCPFFSPAVEFGVEDLLPGAEIKVSFSYRD